MSLKITRCPSIALSEWGFKHPSKFFIIDALGDAVFIHTRERVVAEQWVSDNYGKGFYKLRTSSMEKSTGDLTCTGSNTRKGFSKNLKGLRG